MNQTDKKRVMIITGEASGDLHGGNLVKAIKAKEPSVSFTGIGGDGLRTQGVNILYDIKDLSVSGFTEVFSSLPSIFKALGMVKSFLEGSRPDLLIVIDFAEFNLRVATYAKKYNIPVVYYIPPKIWSWRTYRVKKIKERVDHVAVILPFEADFFNAHGVSARYVGNPLLDDYPQPVPWENKPTAPVIGLLPGSRKSEITQHLPILLDAAQLIQKKIKDATFMLSLAPSADRNYVEGLVASHGGNISIELVSNGVRSIFDKATFLVAASGTVTLEAALAGIPMVIIYKVSAVTYWVAKRLAKVDYIGLANLIAGEEIVPELIQDKAEPQYITDTVVGMLNDPTGLELMRQRLLGIREKLGGPGASSRMANFTLSILTKDMNV